MFQQKLATDDIESVLVDRSKIYVGFYEAVKEEHGAQEIELAQIEEMNRRAIRGERQQNGAVATYSVVKLIRELGFASATEAQKLLKAGAVSIDGVKHTSTLFQRTGMPGPTESNPLRLRVRVGRREKVAVIS